MVHVRKAASHEYEKFHHICDNDLPHPLSLEQRLVQRRREFQQIDQQKCIALFAEHTGEVVGSVQLRLNDKCPSECRIHALVVTKPKRRSGIASKLMQELEQTAQKLSYERLWLTVHTDNVPALALYEKLGFERITDSLSSQTSETIQLQKILTQ